MKIKQKFASKHILYASVLLVIGITFYGIGLLSASKNINSNLSTSENKISGQSSLPVSSKPATEEISNQKSYSNTSPSVKPQSGNNARPSINQNTSKASTAPAYTYTPPTYTCNQDTARYLANIRDSRIQGETARYQQKANELSSYYGGHGLGDSSFSANAQDLNTKTYQSNLAQIYNEYLISMQNAHCS